MNCARLLPSAFGASRLLPALLILVPLWIGGCSLPAESTDQPTPPAEAPIPPSANSNTPAAANPPTASGLKPPTGGCVDCHSLPLAEGPLVVAAAGGSEHVFSGDRLADSDCEICHELTRHSRGTVRLWQDPDEPSSVVLWGRATVNDPATAERMTAFCLACHDQSEYALHSASGDESATCVSCHDPHDPNSANLALLRTRIRNQTLGEDQQVLFTARSGPGSFSHGTGANDGVCQVCHTATRYHRYDGAGAAHHEGVDCTQCHTHADGFVPAGGTSCIGCHSSAQGARPAVVNADGSGGHHPSGGDSTDADCIVCHDMSRHQQGAVRVWEDPGAPSSVVVVTGEAAQLTAFCRSCHSGANHPTVHTTGTAWAPACLECHELHDPDNDNLALIADTIHNSVLGVDKPLVFTARSGPGSFSDGTGPEDGVCQVCHTATRYHRHDGSGTPHRAGEDCTACHEHADAFIPVGGTSCVGCHASQQGARRAVMDEFALASHHIQGTAVTDADCLACHEMSEHLTGQIRLENVDDAGNPAAVTSLNGDPLSDPAAAAQLEPFCLACHDDDAAGGSAPFSNGAMPTPIDAALWSAASHATGQTTCMGDGQTFGCHGTGHGSVKRKLLAPSDASQPGVSGDPLREEEGLCYSCHDADGPALSDVQSEFALSTHHNVSSLEQLDGSRVECVNCHNPHVATAAAPLIDPDTGETWSGSGEAFCLTCHDGSPPAGVSFPPAAPGTGYDKTSFTTSTHDDETGGNSCRHCHRVHGSDNLAILRERYVVADNTPYVTGGDEYAACWLCHREDRVISQNNAFADLHEEHVGGENAPCIICHDVHAGFDPGEPGLINMDYPVRRGGYDIEFIDGKDGSTSFWIINPGDQGACTIRCHGESHAPETYEHTYASTAVCTACH